MSATGLNTTPLQASSSLQGSSTLQGVKLDVDGIIMQLLAAKDTPGKQVVFANVFADYVVV